MEDALVHPCLEIGKTRSLASLNPCFNGRCTSTNPMSTMLRKTSMCLNPCFNGRCTSTLPKKFGGVLEDKDVLILVLMEDALVRKQQECKQCKCRVLILVLMEDALVLTTNLGTKKSSI